MSLNIYNYMIYLSRIGMKSVRLCRETGTKTKVSGQKVVYEDAPDGKGLCHIRTGINKKEDEDEE